MILNKGQFVELTWGSAAITGLITTIEFAYGREWFYILISKTKNVRHHNVGQIKGLLQVEIDACSNITVYEL